MAKKPPPPRPVCTWCKGSKVVGKSRTFDPRTGATATSTPIPCTNC